MDIFILEESSVEGKYLIQINHEAFNLIYTTGSYHIICARLMNLSFAQWLRFCRDICGAEIIGKNQFYPTCYMKDNAATHELVRLLNKRANLVLWLKEHPNWREHQTELIELKEKKIKLRYPNAKY